jgi:hypothetical protein
MADLDGLIIDEVLHHMPTPIILTSLQPNPTDLDG